MKHYRQISKISKKKIKEIFLWHQSDNHWLIMKNYPVLLSYKHKSLREFLEQPKLKLIACGYLFEISKAKLQQK